MLLYTYTHMDSLEAHQTDSAHFDNLRPPLSPDQSEVRLYEEYVRGPSILLLGYTKELSHLASDSIDLNPPAERTDVTKGNWFEIKGSYDTIIGDGVLNLVGGSLVEYLSHRTKRLVIRFFTEKIEGMKYATFFRHNTSFLLPDHIIDTKDKCRLLIWNFNQSGSSETI